MIAFAVDSEITSCLPASLAEPHVWLGLDLGVRDPVLVVEAARKRLDMIRDANGSEWKVKDVLVAIIITARQELLSFARGPS
jgi:hypothetical protein